MILTRHQSCHPPPGWKFLVENEVLAQSLARGHCRDQNILGDSVDSFLLWLSQSLIFFFPFAKEKSETRKSQCDTF